MSTESVRSFFDHVTRSPELKERVESALEDRGPAAAFEIVEIAREDGHDFTATELRDFVAAGSAEGELSDADLQAVAGGVRMLRARLPGLRKLRRMSLMDLGRGRVRKLEP